MKTVWRICLVLVVLALPVATAAAAVGKKPPTTTAPGPTLFGTTCASDPGYEAALASHGYALTENGFSFTLSGRSDALCIDVLHGTPGIWMVSIVGNAGTTTLNRILLVPRDSIAPGDSCGGVDLRRVALPLQQQLPHPDDTRFDVIANGYVNACGTAFGEKVDLDGNPETPDLEVGTVMPDFPHPLAFQVNMAAAAATSSVTVTVTLP